MSSVVLILGAGTSKECGAPLMGEFLDVAADLLRAGDVKETKPHFERVFDTIGKLQAVHSKSQLDLTNIESIFTALELGNIIKRLPGVDAEEIPQCIASLKELIVKTLEIRIRFPTKHSHIGAPRPYDNFTALLEHLRGNARPSHSVSVITFNYDIAADMALFRANLGPDYVIEQAPKRYAQIPLMKLHGSLNWASVVDPTGLKPLHLSNYFQEYSIQGWDEEGSCMLPVGSQLVEYFRKREKVEVNPEPVIVPPTWNKADYHHALTKVWAAAATNLSEAEYIFVIGYSLPDTDAFFRLLYALGSVGKSPLRALIVYNPDSTGSVDRRFRELLGPAAQARYKYRPIPFTEAIEEINSMFPGRT
jgi:hypothetical protein